MKIKNTNYVLVGSALILATLLMIICYPGFMSYDSFRMLEEARSSVMGNPFPPGPVYFLRFLDIFGNGPTVMIFCQNFIILVSFFYIFKKIGLEFPSSITAVLFIIFFPVVIGCMLVLWKDVSLTAFMLCSFALIFNCSTPCNVCIQNYRFCKWLAIFLLFMATLMRLNAITGVMIILIYWVLIYYPFSSLVKKFLIFSSLIASVLLAEYSINNFKFPSLDRLPSNTIIYSVMAYDLVGISGWSRDSLIPFESISSPTSKTIDIVDIDKIYSPLGALVMSDLNVANGNLVTIFPPVYLNSDIFIAWIKAIIKHPFSYLNYRADLFGEIIGATAHETFEPTHFNKIDSNPFGIKFIDNEFTNFILRYIKYSSGLFFGKPWVVFIFSFFSVIAIYKEKNTPPNLRQASLFTFASSIAYLLPFFFISGTGEVRYSFPSIAMAYIPVVIFFSVMFKKLRVVK